MKRFIAFILAFSMIFLCACSDNGEKAEETNASSTEATTAGTTTAPITTNPDIEYFSEWGSDSLPADFPVPPEMAHDLTVDTGEANDAYSSDWVRIKFTCPLNELYKFTNRILSAGYIGGTKLIEQNSSYFTPGFNGNWQNGKHLIKIAGSEFTESGEITVVIYIAECQNNFPAVLTSMVPEFKGYSKNSGLYTEYDENGNKITNEFIGNLNASSWTWDFGFENAFIGVTEEDLDAYTNELYLAEYAGVSSTSTVDGCTVISFDLVKETESGIYGVFIVYNQILKTMDILYTNDISLIVEM